RGEAGQVAKVGEIAGDVDRANAGRRARRFNIVDAKLRMPVWAAQKNCLQVGFVGRVGGVTTPAADQANVLDALDALTYAEFCRSHIHIMTSLWRPGGIFLPDGVRPLSNSMSPDCETPRAIPLGVVSSKLRWPSRTGLAITAAQSGSGQRHRHAQGRNHTQDQGDEHRGRPRPR